MPLNPGGTKPRLIHIVSPDKDWGQLACTVQHSDAEDNPIGILGWQTRYHHDYTVMLSPR